MLSLDLSNLSVASAPGPVSWFHSVLFDAPDDADAADDAAPPDYFGDLNLNQVLAELTVGREQYRLDGFFGSTLRRAAAVEYRHEVLRDLDRSEVKEPVERFAEAMRAMRTDLEQAMRLRHRLQKDSLFVDAVQSYCDAVRTLAGDMDGLDLGSRGLRRLRDYLAAYVASAEFTGLTETVTALKDALAEIRYAVRVRGATVTVTGYADQPDYSVEVQETFARFKQRDTPSRRVTLPDYLEMNHVEAQVLDGVARLFPEVFAARADFSAQHGDFVDATVGRFDREVQFYLAYLDLIRPFRSAGLPFCYPQVSEHSKETAVEETFDLALATTFLPEGAPVVGNDLGLAGPERMFVVTGPNNGGKTTFARIVGQLHHLAGLGLLVPGRSARMFLPDRIFTHFEREEELATLRGKFEDELVRVRSILEQATSDSVIVMNESFGSTSLSDALYVGTQVVREILELGCLGVYVTFIDEIASLSEATVSMVAQVAPENPAERTFKVIRAPSDGRAYAWAIAEKYGLSYERLMERVNS